MLSVPESDYLFVLHLCVNRSEGAADQHAAHDRVEEPFRLGLWVNFIFGLFDELLAWFLDELVFICLLFHYF